MEDVYELRGIKENDIMKAIIKKYEPYLECRVYTPPLVCKSFEVKWHLGKRPAECCTKRDLAGTYMGFHRLEPS